MAELLTREKQFMKLNQELDRMAVTTAAAGRETECRRFTTDNKFQTFQKSKGPSTLLRKQGAAGDGYKQINDITNIREPKKAEGVDTYRSTNRHNNNGSAHSTPTQPGQSLYAFSPPAAYRFLSSKCTESNRSPPASSGRTSTSRMAPANNATFSIRYRNPKFLESPSLEVLVKEESSALRCQTEDLQTGSLSSMPADEVISTGRQSQISYHTISSKKNVSSEGLIKFLKSKIVILEEEHEHMSQEMARQKEHFENALKHAQTLEQQRDQANGKNSALSEQLARSEKQLEEANKLMKERSMEQNALNKELETVKREFKLLTQTNANLEKRLFRTNEELENVRRTVSEMKLNEREHREVARKDGEMQEMQIKSLKKQRVNLLNAYKKQLFLIDNLKRQNALLEQAKMLDIGEKEFIKVLDWDIKR